jgi:O-antigen ligase
MIVFYLLIGSLPLTHHPLLTKVLGEVTLIKLLGGICLFYALLHTMVRRSVPRPLAMGPVLFSSVFFVVGAVSFFAHGASFTLKSSSFAAFLSGLLLVVVTPMLVDTLPRLQRVLLVIIGSVGFASLYVVREWVKFHNLYANFRGWGGVTEDPNYFTAIALLWLPLAFYLARTLGSRWQKLFCWGCFLTTLLATTLAASRGGFLGLIAGILFMVGRSPQRVRSFVLIMLLAVPLLTLAPSSPLRRLTDPTYSDREAEYSRVVVWKAGLRMLQAHPLMGVGLDKFWFRVGEYQDQPNVIFSLAHNTYLQVAAELGLLGFLPFLAIIVSTYRLLGQAARRVDPSLLSRAAVALQAGLVAWLVGVFFITGLQRTFWLLVGLAIALSCLKTQDTSKRPELPGAEAA